MIMMSVVVSVSVIVIRVGIDMLFSNKQKTNKQRIMNHEDYAPTILVYHHLTIPGKQERKKKENQKKKKKENQKKKKSNIPNLCPNLLSIILYPLSHL